MVKWSSLVERTIPLWDTLTTSLHHTTDLSGRLGGRGRQDLCGSVDNKVAKVELKERLLEDDFDQLDVSLCNYKHLLKTQKFQKL